MTTALGILAGLLILAWICVAGFFAIVALRLSRTWRDVMVVLVDEDEDWCEDSECAVCKLYRDTE